MVGPTLRDRLAIDRTALANERTLLAYVRTALALAIVGGSLLKFFESLAADAAGCLFLVGGFLTLYAGLRRFLKMRRRLSATEYPGVIERESLSQQRRGATERAP